MAREEGIEPPTKRLTAACSTAELLPNTKNESGNEPSKLGKSSALVNNVIADPPTPSPFPEKPG